MARPAHPIVQARLITDADGDEIYVYHCPHCDSPHRDTVAYPHITCQSERCYKPFSIIYPGLPDDPNPHQHPEINEELVTHELNSHSEGLPHKTGSGLPVEQDKHDPLPSHEYLREALLGRYGADQQRIAEVGLKWVQTMLDKNSDYGSTIFRSPRLAPELPPGSAILTRMSDKIDRLTNLAGKKADPMSWKPQVKEETFDDTVNDLGAYCLLYLARPNREKPMTPDEVVKTFMENTNPLRFETPQPGESNFSGKAGGGMADPDYALRFGSDADYERSTSLEVPPNCGCGHPKSKHATTGECRQVGCICTQYQSHLDIPAGALGP